MLFLDVVVYVLAEDRNLRIELIFARL